MSFFRSNREKIKRKIELKPPEIKAYKGGLSIGSKYRLGPCFLYNSEILINELLFMEGESMKDIELKFFLDFFNEKGQFLGSYKLPEWTQLITIDHENNFYFVQLEPVPKVIRSTLNIE